MQFGRKSEKVEHQIEQLTLKLEELETSRAESEPVQESEPTPGTPRAASAKKRKPSRRPLPEHLLRVIRVHEPAEQACPQCGGTLHKLGEDISEVLDYIPASFVVIRHVRPKMSCCGCDAIVQAPTPGRPIERGLAGAGLLAHVLTAKYCDHLPLNRQHAMYAREGVDLDDLTLADGLAIEPVGTAAG